MSPETLISNLEKFVLQPIVILLFSLAIVVFIWGVVEFLIKFDSEEAKQQGKKHMLWGVIGMAIMLSAIGIVNLIGNTLYDGDFPQDPRDFRPSEKIN